MVIRGLFYHVYCLLSFVFLSLLRDKVAKPQQNQQQRVGKERKNPYPNCIFELYTKLIIIVFGCTLLVPLFKAVGIYSESVYI